MADQSGKSNESDESAPWGVLKTAKVVIPLSILVVLVLFAFQTHDTALKVSKAKGGECIVLPTESVTNVLQNRDCERPHTGEVYVAFEYPAIPAPGEPTPEENCRELPLDLTAEQAAQYQRFLDIIARPELDKILVSNNEDETMKRDYACIIGFPERTGSYLREAMQTSNG